MPLHQGKQQVFLGREIAVEGGGLHADLGGELAHRDGLVAMPRDQIDRRVADRHLGFFAVGACGARHPQIIKQTFI